MAITAQVTTGASKVAPRLRMGLLLGGSDGRSLTANSMGFRWHWGPPSGRLDTRAPLVGSPWGSASDYHGVEGESCDWGYFGVVSLSRMVSSL